MSRLAIRDTLVERIQAQILTVRSGAVVALSEISAAQQNNEYLSGVYEDYNRYANALLEAKQGQLNGLKELAAYLSQAEEAADMTALTLRRIKHQEKDLKRRIAEVRSETNQLVTSLRHVGRPALPSI